MAYNCFIYLEVHVTIRFENLFQANFAPLLTRTKDNLECWSLLHLSLVAIINSIKMNTLPKFLYLYQCLPIFLPNLFQKDRGPNIILYMGHKAPQDTKTAFAEAQIRRRSSYTGFQILLLGR